MTPMTDIREQALNPGTYGQTCRVTFLPSGGLALEPMDDAGRPQPGRTIVLDPAQASTLVAAIRADKGELRELIAKAPAHTPLRPQALPVTKSKTTKLEISLPLLLLGVAVLWAVLQF